MCIITDVNRKGTFWVRLTNGIRLFCLSVMFLSMLFCSKVGAEGESNQENVQKGDDWRIYIKNISEIQSNAGKIYVPLYDDVTLEIGLIAAEDNTFMYKWFLYDATSGMLDLMSAGWDMNTFTVKRVVSYTRYVCSVTDKNGVEKKAYFYIYPDNEFEVEAIGGSEYLIDADQEVALQVKVSARNKEVTYTWYKADEEDRNRTEIDGEINAMLKVCVNEPEEIYYCVVKDLYGSEKEVRFKINIDNHFQVLTQEKNEVILEPGEKAELEVEVLASDMSKLHYQWYYEEIPNNTGLDGLYGYAPIDGATLAKYTTDEIREKKKYCCLIDDGYGNSRQIYFTVNADNQFEVDENGYNEYKVYINGAIMLQIHVSAKDMSGIEYNWFFSDGAPDCSFNESKSECYINGVNEYFHAVCDVSDPYGNIRTIVFEVYPVDYQPSDQTSDRPSAPDNLRSIGTSGPDMADGKITGVTEEMEYATNEDFSDAKRCLGTRINGLAAGVYYVRYAETQTKPAGYATSVWVHEGPLVHLIVIDGDGSIMIDREGEVGALIRLEHTWYDDLKFALWYVEKGRVNFMGDNYWDTYIELAKPGEVVIRALYYNDDLRNGWNENEGKWQFFIDNEAVTGWLPINDEFWLFSEEGFATARLRIDDSINMEVSQTFDFSELAYPLEFFLWKSSDETIASVDDKGVIKALKSGRTYLTVSAKDGSGVSKTCVVTVTDKVSKIVADCNGDGQVNRADRMYLARAIAGWEGYDLPSCEIADFNGDGEVNRADRMYLARAIAGWESYVID